MEAVRSNALGRKETTKAMVEFMFVVLEQDSEFTLDDMKLVCAMYERLIDRIHEDFLAIASIVMEEGVTYDGS